MLFCAVSTMWVIQLEQDTVLDMNVEGLDVETDDNVIF
jgi:hypothetical protein